MDPAAPSLEAFRRSQHNRLMAVVALLALLIATTGYVAHGFPHDLPLSQHSSTPCDLCLHFSGTAGAPANADLVGKPPLVAFVPAAPATPSFSSRPHPTQRLP